MKTESEYNIINTFHQNKHSELQQSLCNDVQTPFPGPVALREVNNTFGGCEITNIKKYKKGQSVCFSKTIIVVLLAGLILAGICLLFRQNNMNNKTVFLPKPILKQEQNSQTNASEVSKNITGMQTGIPGKINIKVNWEVPEFYSSSESKFVQIGKSLQEDLERELHETDKNYNGEIKIELDYNEATDNFNMIKVVSSTGNESFNDIVMSVLDKTFNRQSLEIEKYSDTETIFLTISADMVENG